MITNPVLQHEENGELNTAILQARTGKIREPDVLVQALVELITEISFVIL